MLAPGLWTLRHVWDLFLHDDEPLAESTKELRGYQLNRWDRFAGEVDVRDITTETLNDYRDSIEAAGMSPETAETDINTVFRILEEAKIQGLVAELPKRGKRRKGTPTKTPKISVGEFERFIVAIAETRLSLARRKKLSQGRINATQSVAWARAFWGTALFSALRRTNLRKLRWEYFGAEELDVRQFKTGNLVAIPIHPVWRRLLDELPGAWTSGLVFQISEKTLYRDMNAIKAIAGTYRIIPQSVRKLAARMYDKAHAGAGRLILGRPFPGADGNYLDAPETLQLASSKLQIPLPFLTEEERERGMLQETQLMTGYRDLRPEDRETILRMVLSLRHGR